MLALERLDHFRQQSESAASIDALGAMISAEIVGLGFERFAYVALQRPNDLPGRIYFGTYPADWAKFYNDRHLSLHDPIMSYPFEAVQPFLWDDVARARGDRSSELMVFGPAGDAGLQAGAGVPIHGPAGGVAVFNVSKDCDGPILQALFAEQRYALQLIAYAAHDAALRLTGRDQAGDAVHLTARQREVLLWAVHGKTNWEIGEILGLAEDTIRQHLRLVCRALGASNRAQAGAIAINRNIISADSGTAGNLMTTRS